MIILIIALLLFLCSLLIFFDLSAVPLWKITIAATEFGHWFVVLPFAIAVFCRFQNPLFALTTIVSLLTAAVLLFPSFSAASIGRVLPGRLEQSFGVVRKYKFSGVPFEWRRLWLGIPFFPVQKEVFVFSEADQQRLILNFYRARSQRPVPCVIVIHTGGWDSGSPDEFESMNQFLAHSGFAVAAISYRFAPAFRWPAQKEDALGALIYLKKNAGELGIDPSRFVFFGRSAGGQIAEAVAYTSNDPAVKGCIALYAPADLVFAYEHLSAEPDILDSKTLLLNFLGGTLEDSSEQYRGASAYYHVSRSSVPTLLIHGAKDPLTWYRQSERLSKKLTEFSVPNLYLELPWATHAFDFNHSGPGGQLCRYSIEYFLCSVTS